MTSDARTIAQTMCEEKVRTMRDSSSIKNTPGLETRSDGEEARS